jgi:hypothetical protein
MKFPVGVLSAVGSLPGAGSARNNEPDDHGSGRKRPDAATAAEPEAELEDGPVALAPRATALVRRGQGRDATTALMIFCECACLVPVHDPLLSFAFIDVDG